MAKTVTLRIDDKVYNLFARCAEAERRSLSSYIELAARAYSQEAAFVDDLEMEEILSSRSLLHRLRQGSREAKLGKGRLVG